jgi:aminoglycoside phosphotransferase (APT) family kinase protein
MVIMGHREALNGTGLRTEWARAKRVLRHVLQSLGERDPEVAIGFVRFLGEGLSYRAYRAECRLPTAQGDRLADLVVRLPRADCPDDLTTLARREIDLLHHLSKLDLPVRLPRVIGAVPVAGALGLVQEMVHGVPIDLRASRWPGGRPWEVVALAAAVCHGVDPHTLPASMLRHPTRRAHASAVLDCLRSLEIPEAKDAYAWGIAHLPANAPTCLLHGDLLGQNLLVGIGEDERLGIIDWAEAQIGDPAYDLAIVTRGSRRPFQIEGGLERLVDDYNARGGLALRPADVHLYEICLVAGFYEQDAHAYGVGSPHAENTRATLRNVLRRAELGS